MAMAAAQGAGSPITRRINKDYKALMEFAIKDESNSFIVSDHAEDLSTLAVLVKGKISSRNYNSVYHELSFVIPDEYPKKPPEVKFETPVWHPNVSLGGKICVDFLEPEKWAWGTTLLMIVEGIQSLLDDPNPTSPLNSDAGAMKRDHPHMYDATVKMWCHIHANGPDTNIPHDYSLKLNDLVKKAHITRESALRRLSCSFWIVNAIVRETRSDISN